MRKQFKLLICLTAISLAACSNAKEQLGLTRKAPDEFAVVKRAPLEMPPDYTLRPPRPGAARPQETAPADQARAVVFGNAGQPQTGTSPDSAEAYLLQQTGSTEADPSIRDTVDRETAAMKPEEIPVARKLLGFGRNQKPPASVVDPVAEAERIAKNREEGKPITEGETPTVKE